MPHSAHQRCGPGQSFDAIIEALENEAASGEATPAPVGKGAEASAPRRPEWPERLPKAFGSWTVFCAPWQDLSKWPDGRAMGCVREVLLNVSKENADLLDLNDVSANRFLDKTRLD